MTRDELQAFHQDVLQHHSFVMDALAYNQEGKPDYDCKGFCALEASLLVHEHGYAYSDMKCLLVAGAYGAKHMVLQVGEDVLDDGEPRLTKPSDYTPIAPSMPASMIVLLCGMKL